jgi:virulence-associated protein VapD
MLLCSNQHKNSDFHKAWSDMKIMEQHQYLKVSSSCFLLDTLRFTQIVNSGKRIGSDSGNKTST